MAQSITDLLKGRVLRIDGEAYVIIQNSFMRKAQRKPVMRTKLRGIRNNKVIEKTFIAGESFELVDLERSKAQYMYKDNESVHFMDNETYDQFAIPMELIESQIQYLKEGEDTLLTKLDGEPISVELPPKVVLEVKETTPGVKGDTASGGTKAATLESGLVIQVPLFINEGDSVRVNTETGAYVERA